MVKGKNARLVSKLDDFTGGFEHLLASQTSTFPEICVCEHIYLCVVGQSCFQYKKPFWSVLTIRGRCLSHHITRPRKSMSPLKPKAVLHSCRKDKLQASVTADLYLPVYKTAANQTHLATCLESSRLLLTKNSNYSLRRASTDMNSEI